jgi:hypothetical protein
MEWNPPEIWSVMGQALATAAQTTADSSWLYGEVAAEVYQGEGGTAREMCVTRTGIYSARDLRRAEGDGCGSIR